MSSYTYTHSELNAKALEQFIYQPVNKTMISFLADAAFNVIVCDSTLKPTPIAAVKSTASPSPADPQRVQPDDGGLPTLEEFITQLVCSSNVQVPTLMSTLVYLTRLRSRLQPMARGLRCTTHRIFLAALILAAKYLNDSSPKNKHWASYSNMATDLYSFGFSRTEVNLMEKQLLYLLDWDLRIREEDLYRELDAFLEPIRHDIELKHARRLHRRRVAHEEQLRQLHNHHHHQQTSSASSLSSYHQQQTYQSTSPAAATAVMYPTPPSSTRNNSYSSSTSSSSSSSAYSTTATTSRSRVPSLVSTTSSPPELAFSSGAASPESSMAVSRINTPLSFAPTATADTYMADDVVVVDDSTTTSSRSRKISSASTSGRLLLPYEAATAGPDELQGMQDDANKTKKLRMGRNVLGRVFGAVTVR